MMQKMILGEVSDEIKNKVGYLILLFSQVEWFAANVIYYGHMTKEEYQKLGGHIIGTKYLHTIFGLNMDKKIDMLRRLGFDATILTRVQVYRNTLAHGLIFNKDGGLNVSKPHKKTRVPLNETELDQNITQLEIEGGKLWNFLESKGFKPISLAEQKKKIGFVGETYEVDEAS